jgi:hypothetical protein
LVDCEMVLEMTMTGSDSAGFLNARKILVNRIKRSTTKHTLRQEEFNK